MPVLNRFSWAAARVLLAPTAPLQNLVDPPSATHLYINEQALVILAGDGLARETAFLEQYLDCLQRGVHWADEGWKNLAHYFNPSSGRGMNFWPGAAGECERYFGRAAAAWRAGHTRRSMFYLGAAAHLVQDLCVPYHAGGVTFAGHQVFERWAQEHRHSFRAVEGLYGRAADPGGWVVANAREAAAYLPDLLDHPAGGTFHHVAAAMLPLAQRTTAGFLSYFLRWVAF